MQKESITKDVIKDAVAPYIEAAKPKKPKPKPKPVYKIAITKKVVPHETGHLPGWEHIIEEIKEGDIIDNTTPKVKPGSWLTVEDNMPRPAFTDREPAAPTDEEPVRLPVEPPSYYEINPLRQQMRMNRPTLTHQPKYTKTDCSDQAARLRKLQGKVLPGEK